MKLLLITNAYPNKEKIYSNAFLHGRVKAYQKYGHEVEVIVMSTKVAFDEEYDGVTIKYLDEYQIADYINHHSVDRILVHFVNKKIYTALKMMKNTPKVLIWFHGFEAEPWYARYYNFLVSKGSFLNHMKRKDSYYEETKEMLQGLIRNESIDKKFIYVSESYKKKYVDPYLGIQPDSFYIISNPIDPDIFTYNKKNAEDRFKICNIRPYTARNYANDITRDVILGLSKKRYFNKLQFHLYGDGPLFNTITEPLRKFDNVSINKGFVHQKDIVAIHKENGIYLGPTRHDSQGVSLCEAMSSGLVPISNDIGAIAEFVNHAENGLLAKRDDVKQMIDYIDYLVKNPDEFLRMSENASRMIIEKTGKEVIINKELEVIESE
ncbi:glycosyltransferase family 4 protein [Macrococcus animalis]|uniref:glycosyltransferase family 4 protein n=1 Tax=Macrococcus animalis TaxID=3395467 RepID=UPI0039BE1449